MLNILCSIMPANFYALIIRIYSHLSISFTDCTCATEFHISGDFSIRIFGLSYRWCKLIKLVKILSHAAILGLSIMLHGVCLIMMA